MASLCTEGTHKKRGKDARIGSAIAVLRIFRRSFWLIFHILLYNLFAAFNLFLSRFLRII